MAVNLIVGAITLLMLGFGAVWFLRPGLRSWMEEPKYKVLDWERKYPSVQRPDTLRTRSVSEVEDSASLTPQAGI